MPAEKRHDRRRDEDGYCQDCRYRESRPPLCLRVDAERGRGHQRRLPRLGASLIALQRQHCYLDPPAY